MTGHQGRTLPIRRWLAASLAATFLIPVLTLLVIGLILFPRTEGPQTAADRAVSRLREDAGQWQDPEWQAATRDELVADGVDFVLLVDGQEVFRTTGEPLGAPDTEASRIVRQVVVSTTDPERFATIYSSPTTGPPEELRAWFVPLALITVLLLTLAGIGWFFGRTVVAPLTAASSAARQIAGGDLDIALPSSRVREVAALNSAVVAMSEALRSSLHRQAEMEQERRMLISAIVHDLRTPLFSLRGSLEGLQEGIADTPEKRDRYIDVARDKSDELERLIADLFAFTRLEYLDQEPDRVRLNLAELLPRLAEGFRSRADASDVHLTLSGSLAPCIVSADEHLLSRAVGNLLDNAVRHTPSGGTIDVSWQIAAGQATFAVADTGPGIPEADLPHLFTPLFRGETSRNRKTGGAGLGLTIARRIMNAHNGDLIAANRATGGAVFTGVLPRPLHTAVPERESTATN